MKTTWNKPTKYLVAIGFVLLGIFILYLSRSVLPLRQTGSHPCSQGFRDETDLDFPGFAKEVGKHYLSEAVPGAEVLLESIELWEPGGWVDELPYLLRCPSMILF